MEVVERIANADIIPAMGPTDGRPVNDYVMKNVSVVKMPDGQPHVKVEVVEREAASKIAPEK